MGKCRRKLLPREGCTYFDADEGEVSIHYRTLSLSSDDRLTPTAGSAFELPRPGLLQFAEETRLGPQGSRLAIE